MYDKDWVKEAAFEKVIKGVSWPKLQQIINSRYNVNFTIKKLRYNVCRHPLYSIGSNYVEVKNTILSIIKKSPKDKSYFCKKFSIDVETLDKIISVMKEEGFLINDDGDTISLSKSITMNNDIYSLDWDGNRIITFGVVSDTHLGSKWQQLTLLNEMYDIFEINGVSLVFHCGDITDGIKMRKGHEYDIFLQGADEQADYAIEYYPKRKSVKTVLVGGNHDYSAIKHAGHNVCKQIANKRDDIEFIGMSNARYKLTPNCVVELNHPEDGAAYALSYSIQKYIDTIPSGSKPNILLNGHHHKQLQIFYRNIHAFEIPCFQSQTRWMKAKRIGCVVGGFIIEVHVDDESCVKEIVPRFYPFYNWKEKDY